jgi:hypothetical protein
LLQRAGSIWQVFAGQQVGIRQVDDRIWLVSFMHYDLGYFDDETCRLEPIENPFGPSVLPMPSEYTVTHVPGIDPSKSGRGDWIRTSDPLRPRQVRYQAALRPDWNFLRF